MKEISWTTSFLGGEQILTENGVQVGYLKKDTWGRYSNGNIYNNNFTFTTNGIFNQSIEITNSITKQIIGSITFNTWGTKAFLLLKDKKEYNWKYTNGWQTKWTLSRDNRILIDYRSSIGKGSLSVHGDVDPLLILCGLIIRNYFEYVFLVALIPIFIVIFSNS